MKMFLRTARGRFGVGAFTLLEAVISMALLTLMVGSVTMCSLWAYSMSFREQIWLGSSDDAGKALGMMYAEIRSAASNSVGQMVGGSFVWAGMNTNQTGNALMIYPSTNANAWIVYYYTTNQNLVRTNWTGASAGSFRYVTANYITNDKPIFTETDYLGNVLTNPIATPVIHVYLAFTKLANPQVSIAPGSPVDYYVINSIIASRNRP